MKFAAFVFSVMLSLMPLKGAEAWAIDGAHSFISFTVPHMNVSTAHGRFNQFSGEITYDAANPSASSFKLTIDMNSVDTNNERRDKHLRSNDFFSSKQFPEAVFTSTSVKDKGNGVLHVSGDFVLAGKTVTVTFEVNVTGPVEGRGGATLRGFEGRAMIKRSDFGITYGGTAIGDAVTILANFEAAKK